MNTVNAGAGALAVTVEGPSKVKLECKEVDDGYEFTYNPTAPGDYLITIRYAGTGIAGSPFKAKIEGLCWFSPLTHSRPRWLSWMRRPTGDQEVAGSTPAEVGNILSWRLIMKYFLRSFSPFR